MKRLPLTIFLPAAGLGERLRPITNHIPKPLLPVLGRPLIESILERLTAVCDGEIGINLHYKPELIRDWARTSPYSNKVRFFSEDQILGTGGALKNAASLLAQGHFIVHNSDILLDIDFSRLIEAHLASGNIATLVTHKHPKLSNVVVDKNGLVLEVENPGDSRPDPNTVASKVAYTGVAIYSPEILTFLPQGVSHATVAWIAAAKAGRRVQTFDVTGAYWSDIGTPASYATAMLDALRDSGETIYLSSAAQCGRIGVDGYVVIESGSTIADDSRLRNCIVLPGANAKGNHSNRIIGPDYVIDLDESMMQPALHAAEQKMISLSAPLFARYFGIANNPADEEPDEADALLIGFGGSDRRYFRIRNGDRTAVLMECRSDDPDFERHLVYTRFLSAHNVPVPDLLAVDDMQRSALFEDLGDTSLFSYMKLPHGNSHIEDVYKSVLDILVMIHTRVTEHSHECPLLQGRIFDHDYLRWETAYFLEQFVINLKNILPGDRGALENEFHSLAQKVGRYPKGVIHRDFQSQNIMITANSVPRVIDFQGARMAPPAYDVASILWDPYHRLDEAVRDILCEYYISEMKANATGFDEPLFRESLVPCRLQRHMQALGAYAFLSMARGKRYFLKHVPEALRLLKEETTVARNDYPELYRLVQNIE